MSKQATGESLNRIEEEVQRFWQLRALHLADQQEPQAESPDSGPYLISHQPLRAAGQSLADQIRLLSTVDLLVRYRTMRGSAVQRLSGWACHGMALETLVERLLPSEGTAPGIADFNAACRQVAEDGIREGQALAQRLGVWSAGEESYRTMDALPIGRVWGALRQLWEEGRLRSERRVVPVCMRCGTPLSESEAVRHLAEAPVQDGYQAWVRLPWDGQAGTYLLIWTPQPWMLLGMVAVAAHPDASYVLVEAAPATSRQRSARQAGREGASPSRLLVAETALRRLEGDYRVVGGLPSRSLRGTRYRPLFTLSLGDQMPLATREGLHRVVMSADLPLDEGTGFQPVTPSFHAGSLALAQTHELPIPEILDEWGNLDDSFARWRGITPLEAEPLVVDDLDSRGLLVRTQVEARPGRRCPYCESALLPLVQPVWLVDAGAGPWIVGRNRAWGTPLPIWSCQACGGQTCIAGLDDLAHRTGLDADRIDPHRPVVDRLVFPCDTCGGPMKRLPPVVDAAFEEAVLAGSMVPRPGPAYVAIGLGDEQTGWLAEVAQVAALLGASTSWQRVIAVPAAEAGMPWEAGRLPLADALRWATFTRTTPDEAEQGFLRPLWVLAAEWLSAPRGGEGEPGQLGAGQILLERWVQARLHQAIGAISRALDGCDPTGAAQELTGLVDDLCGWY